MNGIHGPDLAIAAQPQSIHIQERHSVTFSVTTTAAPGISYQWQSAPVGSSTFTNITDATSHSLTLKSVLLSSNGTQFRVQLHAQDQDITSDVAVLTVHYDQTPPQMTNASISPNLDAIVVSFDEPVLVSR